MQANLAFQYCQKLVILDPSLSKVLLAKRRGEIDYDGVFSFIGGKMETSDKSLLAGMQREKDEEIGPDAKILILPNESRNLLFTKKDGTMMILPHIAGKFSAGEIKLNDEYSEYAWVPLSGLAAFHPKIENIPEMVEWAAGKIHSAEEESFVTI